MATSRPGLGYPAINPVRDQKSAAAAMSNARQRIEALETALQTTQTTAASAAATSQGQIGALAQQINQLAAIVAAFSNDAAVDTAAYTAGEALSVFQPVVPSSTGRVIGADPNDPAKLAGVLGITITTAALGGQVTVQRRGPVTIVGASFTDQQPVYVDTAGGLTQSPIGIAALLVGVAIDATTLFVIPAQPVLLETGLDAPYEDFLPISFKLAQQTTGAGGDAVLYDNQGAAALTSSGQAIFRA